MLNEDFALRFIDGTTLLTDNFYPFNAQNLVIIGSFKSLYGNGNEFDDPLALTHLNSTVAVYGINAVQDCLTVTGASLVAGAVVQDSIETIGAELLMGMSQGHGD